MQLGLGSLSPVNEGLISQNSSSLFDSFPGDESAFKSPASKSQEYPDFMSEPRDQCLTRCRETIMQLHVQLADEKSSRSELQQHFALQSTELVDAQTELWSHDVDYFEDANDDSGNGDRTKRLTRFGKPDAEVAALKRTMSGYLDSIELLRREKSDLTYRMEISESEFMDKCDKQSREIENLKCEIGRVKSKTSKLDQSYSQESCNLKSELSHSRTLHQTEIQSLKDQLKEGQKARFDLFNSYQDSVQCAKSWESKYDKLYDDHVDISHRYDRINQNFKESEASLKLYRVESQTLEIALQKMTAQKDELNQQLDSLQEERTLTEQEIQASLVSQTEMTQNLTSIESQFHRSVEEVNVLKEKLAEKDDQLQDLSTQLTEINEKRALAYNQDLSEKTHDIEVLRCQIRELEHGNNKLTNEAALRKEEAAHAMENQEALQEKMHALKASLDDKSEAESQRVSELTQENQNLQSQLEELSVKTEEVENLYRSSQTNYQTKDLESQTLASENLNLQSQTLALRASLQEVQETLVDFNKKDEEIQELTHENSGLEAKLLETLTLHNELSNKLVAQQEAYTSLTEEHAVNQQDAQTKIQQLSDDKFQLEQQKDQLDKLMERNQAQLDQISELALKLKELESEKQVLIDQFDVEKKEMTDMIADIARTHENVQEEVRKWQKRNASLNIELEKSRKSQTSKCLELDQSHQRSQMELEAKDKLILRLEDQIRDLRSQLENSEQVNSNALITSESARTQINTLLQQMEDQKTASAASLFQVKQELQRQVETSQKFADALAQDKTSLENQLLTSQKALETLKREHEQGLQKFGNEKETLRQELENTNQALVSIRSQTVESGANIRELTDHYTREYSNLSADYEEKIKKYKEKYVTKMANYEKKFQTKYQEVKEQAIKLNKENNNYRKHQKHLVKTIDDLMSATPSVPLTQSCTTKQLVDAAAREFSDKLGRLVTDLQHPSDHVTWCRDTSPISRPRSHASFKEDYVDNLFDGV